MLFVLVAVQWLMYLANIIEREPVEEDIGEELPQTEDAVHHPVGQPFCVVLLVLTLNGFDAGRGSRAQGSHRVQQELYLQ